MAQMNCERCATDLVGFYFTNRNTKRAMCKPCAESTQPENDQIKQHSIAGRNEVGADEIQSNAEDWYGTKQFSTLDNTGEVDLKGSGSNKDD